jgi:hypothetical protein
MLIAAVALAGFAALVSVYLILVYDDANTSAPVKKETSGRDLFKL